jgi:aromatic-amino-acid transaminase
MANRLLLRVPQHIPNSGAEMSTSIFAAVEMAPRDPILGLTESFNAETNPKKVNLGVGVYYGDDGKIPLLAAVKAAEKARLEAMPPRGYQPIEGTPAYNGAVQKLLFGDASPLLAEGRVVTAQCLGGTGALKVGADYVKRLVPESKPTFPIRVGRTIASCSKLPVSRSKTIRTTTPRLVA